MGQGFKRNEAWRRCPYTGRTVTKPKVGDVYKGYCTVVARWSAPGNRVEYMGINSRRAQGDKRNIRKCRFMITGVENFYVYIHDLDTHEDDTLNMGDLVEMEIEPEFLGKDISEHYIHGQKRKEGFYGS